jgi:putative nucleotidyltransferase with HDIG domain
MQNGDEMAETAAKKGGFIELDPNLLKDNTKSLFDVFAQVEYDAEEQSKESLILYAKAPYRWTLRELTELSRVGVTSLFVPDKEKQALDRYKKLNKPLPKIDPNLEPTYRMKAIQDVGQHLVESCFLSEIGSELVEKISEVAGQVVNCLVDEPKSVLQIQSLGEYDMYTYIHSIGVGTLCAAIALQMGEVNKEVLKSYALGGILHDVGKRHIPLNVLNKAGPLTNEEWEVMKSHPQAGHADLKDIELPKVVLEMVGLHHEKLDGSGYPGGLSKDQIPFHVQLATVADIFNALTTSRCYHKKRNRFEGLMFMKHNLRGKINQDIFKALVSCLVQDQVGLSKSLK